MSPYVYRGTVTKFGVFSVTRPDGLPLPLRLDLANHSPTGLAWGYTGSGPAQCALALLADALGDSDRALRVYQTFKVKFLAGMGQDESWEVSPENVRWMAQALENPFRGTASPTLDRVTVFEAPPNRIHVILRVAEKGPDEGKFVWNRIRDTYR